MKHLRIQNYQSLADVEMELSEGVNVIIGPSNIGKTAILRAIRDCAFNATGTDFIRAGTKKTEVTIDGVTWEKGKAVNRYTVDGTVLDKVGKESPVSVKDALGLVEIEFGKGITRRLQIAQQLDPHFIVTESPSDNAKIIGRLSDLGSIYNALREGRREHKETSTTILHLNEQQVERALQVADAAQIVAKAEIALAAAIGAHDKFAGTLSRLEGLTAAQESLRAATAELGRWEVSEVPASRLATVANELAGLLVYRDRFWEMTSEMHRVATQVYDPVKIEQLKGKLSDTMDAYDKRHFFTEADKRIGQARGQDEALGTRLVEINDKLAEMDICPLCNRPVEGFTEDVVKL